jgi:uncharacterized Zn finger protein
MSGFRRAQRGMACPRCSVQSMDEVLRIVPTATQAGLIAYECPGCGYLTSVIIGGEEQHRT